MSRELWARLLSAAAAIGRTLPAVILLLLFSTHDGRAECALKIVFRDSEKPLMMGALGDNTGLLKTLFELAADRIGCTISIERWSKPRAHALLREGTVDFYPAAELTTDRLTYLSYFPNGLSTRLIAITRRGVPDITSLEQIKPMRLLLDSGNAQHRLAAEGYNLVNVGGALTVDRALKLLSADRGDIYTLDLEELDGFLTVTHQTLADLKAFRVHFDCCGGDHPMTVAFARKSTWFQEMPNPAFKPDQALSLNNQPTLPDPQSVAGKLLLALAQLDKDGTTGTLYKRTMIHTAVTSP
jgi:hypothetical protein